MKLRWLRPFIVLTAALIVLISNVISKRPTLTGLIWLLAAIVVFFIIGSLATRILQRTTHAAEQQVQEKAQEQTEEQKTPDTETKEDDSGKSE